MNINSRSVRVKKKKKEIPRIISKKKKCFRPRPLSRNGPIKTFFALCVCRNSNTQKKKFPFFHLKKKKKTPLFPYFRVHFPPATHRPYGDHPAKFFLLLPPRAPVELRENEEKIKKKKEKEKRATLQRPEPPAASRPVVGTGNTSARCRSSPRVTVRHRFRFRFCVVAAWGGETKENNKKKHQHFFGLGNVCVCSLWPHSRRKIWIFSHEK